MNLREGFSRIARVAAVAYWAVALTFVGVSGFNAYEGTRDKYAGIGEPVAPDKPWEAYWKEYRIPVPDGRTITVKAESPEKAREGALEFARSSPKPRPLLAASKAVGTGLGISLLMFAVLWTGYQGLRWIALGFVDPPKPKNGT